MRFCCAVLFVAVVIGSSLAQTPTQALAFQTTALPSGNVDRSYSAMISMTGGAKPYRWAQTEGNLPPGIGLKNDSGALSGIPTENGTFRFKVSVTDTTGKTIVRDFVIEISDDLAIRWLKAPALNSNTLSGSVEVTNGSREVFDITVVVVAVNEVGKAFTLGYEHQQLVPTLRKEVRFSAALPNGHYIVHADAVAEVPRPKRITRVRLQTDGPITVDVNR